MKKNIIKIAACTLAFIALCACSAESEPIHSESVIAASKMYDQILYRDNGTVTWNIYNGAGFIMVTQDFDADGNPVTRKLNNGRGQVAILDVYGQDGDIQESTFTEYDEENHPYHAEAYNSSGDLLYTIDREYYEESGTRKSETCRSPDGNITSVTEYHQGSNRVSRVIVYDMDGNELDVMEFDEGGNRPDDG